MNLRPGCRDALLHKRPASPRARAFSCAQASNPAQAERGFEIRSRSPGSENPPREIRGGFYTAGEIR